MNLTKQKRLDYSQKQTLKPFLDHSLLSLFLFSLKIKWQQVSSGTLFINYEDLRKNSVQWRWEWWRSMISDSIKQLNPAVQDAWHIVSQVYLSLPRKKVLNLTKMGIPYPQNNSNISFLFFLKSGNKSGVRSGT